MTRCRPDQIVNPATNRCVLKSEQIGRRLLQSETVNVGTTEEYYINECDIAVSILKFFQKMFALKTTPKDDPCLVIGRAMLSKCIPSDEIKHYAFRKVLGIGLNGFIIQSMYKGKAAHAVKMVLVGDEAKVKIGNKYSIVTTSEAQIRREFEMHGEIFKKATSRSGFQVLKAFGKLAIFDPPGYGSYRIGVYIMECLPYRTLREIIESSKKKTATPSILEMVGAIPRVIGNLQKHGFAHGDMHFGNIAFDPEDCSRPYVLDFGRTIKLSQFKRASEKASYACMDYLVPLYFMQDDISLYNAYVSVVDIHDLLERVPAALRKKFTEIFSHLTLKSKAKRRRIIDDMFDDQEFNSSGENYFDITCPG